MSEAAQPQQQQGRTTRAREKQRRRDEGIPDDPPKPKRQTLGQHLAEEREKETEILLQDDSIAELEVYSNYDKQVILQRFQAEEVNEIFKQQYYQSTTTNNNNNDKEVKILFLTLQTGEHPKDFTHFCNSSSLRWHLSDLKIKSNQHFFSLPGVVMLFVRGEHVEGTTLTGDQYKYVGIVGVQSVSSGSLDRTYSTDSYIYLDARLVFDYVLTKAELNHFGANVMKCKKNKYGCSLCN